MSDYISGQEIIDEYEIFPFEFLSRFIHQGLIPLGPQSGQPVEVSQLLTAVFNIQGMNNEDPRLDRYQGVIDANNKTTWNEFQLPGDDEIDEKINKALLAHIYDRKLYKKLVALDQMVRHKHVEAKPQVAEHEQPQKRSNRKTNIMNEEKCRERARRIWEVYPNMHPKQLSEYTAFRLQIVMKTTGKEYINKTYKDWISKFWPKEHRYLGPSRSLDIPNAVIEELLKDFY